MIVLRDPALASGIADPDIRTLAEQRFIDICAGEEDDGEEPYNRDLQVIVVEPSDSVAALEAESGCPILRNLCNEIRFGEPGFSPCFELLEQHAGFYELVYVPGDGDSGIDIFIPKADGIDADLLAMCAMYAVPAPEVTEP